MNMAGYTKLFNSILASTIWRSDDKTRIVWITLLAMADKDGIAEGSVPGLADLARVSIEDCESALAELMAPDKYSRTTEFEGRRIEPVDGGWLLLNHAKYRAKMSEDDIREKNRQRQAKWRERHKNNAPSNAESQDVTPSNTKSRQSRHTEAEAYTKAEAEETTKSVEDEELRQMREPSVRGRGGIPRTMTPINPSLDLELQTWVAASAAAFGVKNANSLPKFDKWEKACMTLVSEDGDMARWLDAIKSEKERLADMPHFFSVDNCLQVYQMNGTKKPVESYNHVRNQPTQREAIAEEQARVAREIEGVQ